MRLTPYVDGTAWSVPSSAIEALQGNGITTLELVLNGGTTTLEIAEAAQAAGGDAAADAGEKGKSEKQGGKNTEALTLTIRAKHAAALPARVQCK